MPEASSGLPQIERAAHAFRFAQETPLPGVPKMSWETMATYGAKVPLWFGGGMGTLHKEWRSVTWHDRDHTGSFT